MSTEKLLKSAVHNTSLLSKKGLSDRFFTFWFNRLVYPQIWEDPRADQEALKIGDESRIITIASGSCNLFNYLLHNPKQVQAVDLNGAHIALFDLKINALKHLPKWEDFFDFFAHANKRRNVENYHLYLQKHLKPESIAFWEGKDNIFCGKRIEYFADNFYTHGLLGMFIGWVEKIGKLYGYDLKRMVTTKTMEEQEQIYREEVRPLFDTALVKFLCHRSFVMATLGIPPSQFEAMKNDAEHGIVHLLEQRTHRLACGFPMEENYFAWQAFARHYDTEHQKAIPDYLKKENYEFLKANADRVSINHFSMTDFLMKQSDESMDCFDFLDAQDWMSDAQLEELWLEVLRVAQRGARIIFRTAAEESILTDRLPKTILDQFIYEEAKSKELITQDRSAIYGGMHLYIKR